MIRYSTLPAFAFAATLFTGACGAPELDNARSPQDSSLAALTQGAMTLKVISGETFLKANPVSASSLADNQKCRLAAGATIKATGAPEGIRTGHVRLGTINSITDASGNAIRCPAGLSWIWLPHFSGFPADTGSPTEGVGAGPRSDLDSLIVKIRQAGLAKSPGAKIGLATVWLPASARKKAYSNADEIFNSLSSAKWLWTAAALSRNSVASLDSDARQVFVSSDNTAAGMMIRNAGGISAVNSFLHSKVPGTADWKLCNWSYVSGLGSVCGRNVFTPRTALQFLVAVYDETLGLPKDKVDALDAWARLSPNSGYGGWIGNELPSAVLGSMRHKAGWYNANLNELAIIRPENGGSYAVAMSIEGSSESRSAAAIARMSCLVYHSFNTPAKDPFARCQ